MLRIRDGRMTSCRAKYEARSKAPDAVEVDGDVVAASVQRSSMRQAVDADDMGAISKERRYRRFGLLSVYGAMPAAGQPRWGSTPITWTVHYRLR